MFRWALLPLVFFSTLSFAELPTPSESKRIYSIDLPWDLAVSGAAAVAGVIPYVFESKLITPRCPCPLEEVGAFDRGVIGNSSDGALLFSDVALGLAVGVPVVLNWFYLEDDRAAFWEDALVYAETLLIAGAGVSLTKVIVQRPLPRTFAGDPEYVNIPRGYRSFYSGHVSTVASALAATAFTMHVREGATFWPWLILGAGSLAVAAGRVAGGVHFYSDVLVGFGVGTGIGILVPYLHRRSRPDQTVKIIPIENGAMALWAMRL